ncbi:hypothetical protein NPIL_93191 [Nephila pilipes]|uniref:Uncharacterized protein n=1 Tax=Nephila pilipes TaxID=299642 RepID=A0A8X6UMX6_NEPPI|nr:hypothetical protein NPIL_93191 [Nephila pilipes]
MILFQFIRTILMLKSITMDVNDVAMEEAIKPYKKPILYQKASKEEETIDQRKEDTDVPLPDLRKKRAFRIIAVTDTFHERWRLCIEKVFFE